MPPKPPYFRALSSSASIDNIGFAIPINSIMNIVGSIIEKGDVITAVDGQAMNSAELVSYIGQASVGQQMVFSIYRQGQLLEITVDVGEQIQAALEETQQQTQQQYPGNFPWGRP